MAQCLAAEGGSPRTAPEGGATRGPPESLVAARRTSMGAMLSTGFAPGGQFQTRRATVKVLDVGGRGPNHRWPSHLDGVIGSDVLETLVQQYRLIPRQASFRGSRRIFQRQWTNLRQRANSKAADSEEIHA